VRAVDALERIRANTLARKWSALYQQKPTSDEGKMFAPDRMGLRSNTEDVTLSVRGWDKAPRSRGARRAGQADFSY
jgi:hypothetical protein